MLNRILVRMGARSACCAAKISTWHVGKYYCSKCETWLDSPKYAKAKISTHKPTRNHKIPATVRTK